MLWHPAAVEEHGHVLLEGYSCDGLAAHMLRIEDDELARMRQRVIHKAQDVSVVFITHAPVILITHAPRIATHMGTQMSAIIDDLIDERIAWHKPAEKMGRDI